MLIVVLVLAICAAIAVPKVGEDASTKLTSAARQLAADLAFAQIESISHSDDLRVIVFNTAQGQYSIAAASDTATPITHPVTKNPYLVKFGGSGAYEMTGVTISNVSVGGDDELKFGQYGQLDQAVAATITLACNGRSIVITVNATTGEASIGNVQ